mmetsp:Transcript_79315/g.201906  ORF Transcript_79315/g.201906 Transcript_79315/m.201906 type:complete len:435 (+) Transcript_79315:322-1626(+)
MAGGLLADMYRAQLLVAEVEHEGEGLRVGVVRLKALHHDAHELASFLRLRVDGDQVSIEVLRRVVSGGQLRDEKLGRSIGRVLVVHFQLGEGPGSGRVDGVDPPVLVEFSRTAGPEGVAGDVGVGDAGHDVLETKHIFVGHGGLADLVDGFAGSEGPGDTDHGRGAIGNPRRLLCGHQTIQGREHRLDPAPRHELGWLRGVLGARRLGTLIIVEGEVVRLVHEHDNLDGRMPSAILHHALILKARDAHVFPGGVAVELRASRRGVEVDDDVETQIEGPVEEGAVVGVEFRTQTGIDADGAGAHGPHHAEVVAAGVVHQLVTLLHHVLARGDVEYLEGQGPVGDALDGHQVLLGLWAQRAERRRCHRRGGGRRRGSHLRGGHRRGGRTAAAAAALQGEGGEAEGGHRRTGFAHHLEKTQSGWAVSKLVHQQVAQP